MTQPTVARLFSQPVIDRLFKATQTGKPGSMDRLVAIELAVKFAKTQHPTMFKKEQ